MTMQVRRLKASRAFRGITIALATIATVAFVGGTTAHALRTGIPVFINTYTDLDGNLTTQAHGGVAFVANQPTTEFIECTTHTNRQYANGVETSSRWAYCVAVDAHGEFAGCVTQNPAIIDSMGTIGSSSFVQFTVKEGDCTDLSVSTGSAYVP